MSILDDRREICDSVINPLCKYELHMNWLDMPALSSLRAFAAFADTGNVTSAGDALNVSHAAISQQMRNLETQMNTKLLDRSGRALVLTPQGQQLADALALGFGAIEGAVRDITNADADRPVHISCTPTLASAWLMQIARRCSCPSLCCETPRKAYG